MEFVLNKLPRGQAKKIRWSSSKDGQTMSACAHFICLPPFLPADFKEQAGRTYKRIVEDTEFSSLKISLEISERDERRGLTSIQNLWKSHKASCSKIPE
jgi:hypothetical protein